MSKQSYQDSLYGRVAFDEEISSLSNKALVQRLRHVRLSNIDSIDMPSIANISRYEHVLGVAHLASSVPFRSRLSSFDDLVLKSSALLHDWAITAFGHLVEEGLQYAGAAFDHQERLNEIASGAVREEILGVQRQILVGRETGLVPWARSVTMSATEADRLLSAIMQHIRGRGKLGRVICGDIDLDNIDNVFRVAYHLGLPIDKETPLRLACALVDYDPKSGTPIFARQSEVDIEVWRSTRSVVYEYLMLARRDFAGKAMILNATVRAFQEGEIREIDWSLTDFDFLHRLLSSSIKETRDTAERWIAGELWELTPLNWMEGERPDFKELLAFSLEISDKIRSHCFAYGIKDKRDRRLSVHFDDGLKKNIGMNSGQWLLGVSSPGRAFSSAEITKIFEYAQSYFQSKIVGPATSVQKRHHETQPTLL